MRLVMCLLAIVCFALPASAQMEDVVIETNGRMGGIALGLLTDEGGERALVQIDQPVNKLPDLVAYLVRSLKMMCPTLGKVRIASG